MHECNDLLFNDLVYSGMGDFFCDPPTGFCVVFGGSQATWSEARAYCQSLRMDLAAGQTLTKLNFWLSVRSHLARE